MTEGNHYPSYHYPPGEPPADPDAPLDYPTGPDGAPPGWPQPWYPPPGTNNLPPGTNNLPPGTNNKAVVALISALGGLLCCGLPSIPGLVLGVIAMRETRRTGQAGYPLALTGAIIGGLAAAGWVLMTLLAAGVFVSGLTLSGAFGL